MGKITKQQLRLHEQAEQLLWGGDKPLRRDEIAFCLEHWDPPRRRRETGRVLPQIKILL
jgi:hypothetical protein